MILYVHAVTASYLSCLLPSLCPGLMKTVELRTQYLQYQICIIYIFSSPASAMLCRYHMMTSTKIVPQPRFQQIDSKRCTPMVRMRTRPYQQSDADTMYMSSRLQYSTEETNMSSIGDRDRSTHLSSEF